MIMTVNESYFLDAFARMGRGDQFTYDGLAALFEYLEEMDPDYDLDVIGLCCEYSEYGDMEDYWESSGRDEDDYPDLDALRDETTVIDIPGREGFIIANF